MNLKFERAARQRRRMALWIAVVLHLAAFAAVSYHTDILLLLPKAVQNLFQPETQAGEPQAQVP